MELLNPVVQKQTAEYWMKKTSIAKEAPLVYWEEPGPSPFVFTATIPPAVLNDLRAIARNAVSEYTLLLSLYGFLLYRYFGTSCLISSPDLKLSQPSLTDHLLFYAVDIREEQTLKEVIAGFRQEISQVYDKRDFDISAFLKAVRQKGIPSDQLQAFGFSHSLINEFTTLPEKERIKLLVIEDKGQYRLELRVNGLKDGKLIGKQFLGHYVYLLSVIGTIADQQLQAIEFAQKSAFVTIVPQGTFVPAALAPARALPDLFAARVKDHPDKVALVSRGNHYTYQALDAESNKLAAYLAGQQAGKGERVGILIPRSEWILTGILGIMKTGASFVPIDPAWPAGRIQYILEDAGIKILLTTTDYLPLAKTFTGKFFAFDIQMDMLPPADAPVISIAPEDTAYIMYTSGTTGRPKGVIVPHSGISNYAGWLHGEFGLDASHSSILVTSYAFDLGYTAIWGTIPWGGTLHIPGEDYSKMPEKLFAYLSKEKISFIKLTPSLFKLLLSASGINAPGTSGAGRSLRELPLCLERLFLGGEMIRPDDIAAYLEYYPDTEFVNHYGPTESTVGCVFHRIRQSRLRSFAERPVIGKPIWNTQVRILDAHRHILPDGLWGEIAVSGPGVARGYLNQPEMTAEKFFRPGQSVPGIFYRTGDYGRILENGTIELKGRRDNQAKVRGYRVELEEIEKCLCGYTGIREAALLLHPAGGEPSAGLLAFYTTKTRDTVVPEDALHAYLKTQLPDYMIPSGYFRVDAMPVNENGKLNRKQLSGLVDTGSRKRAKQLLPANETERILLEAGYRH
jgi:amino acid adenylation domain-containing protein